MKLTLVQGLLVATVTIRHRDRCTVVENMVVDTGSAHTWVNVNAVEGEHWTSRRTGRMKL